MARKIASNGGKHKGARTQPTSRSEDATQQEPKAEPPSRKQSLETPIQGVSEKSHTNGDAPDFGYTPPPGYLFELCFLGFLITHLMLQNCIVHGMHVEKYNLNYITFCAILFTKRVSWKFVNTAWCKSQRITVSVAFRILISMIPTTGLLVTMRELISQHDSYTLSLLIFPYIVYFILFGITGTTDSILGFQVVTLQQEQQQSEATPWVLVSYRQHLKHIMYASIEAGYYATFLPVFFLLDRDAIYDQRLTVLTTGHCIINTAVLLLANMVASGALYYHMHAKRIGCWSEARRNSGAPTWTRKEWPHGAQVRYNKKTYTALGQTNTVEPDNWTAWLLYHTFHNPPRTATTLTYVQVVVVAVLLIFLLLLRKWEVVVGWCVLMLASYAAVWYVLGVRRKVLHAG
eukprot:m.10013 g.10013  ORF g.10013 m.10013 type:complete len:403 (-) comp7162_c0_seq1:142-1350(-)